MRERLLPEALRASMKQQAGSFREALEGVLAAGQQVDLPALAHLGCSRAWLLDLTDASRVFVFEEIISEESFACDCCRIMGEAFSAARRPWRPARRATDRDRRRWARAARCRRRGRAPAAAHSAAVVAPPRPAPPHLPVRPSSAAGWQTHPVGNKNWHFIVPAEVRCAALWREWADDRAQRRPAGAAAAQPAPQTLAGPPQEGQYSLADPATLCAITEAVSRGHGASVRIAVPVPDPDAPHHYQVGGRCGRACGAAQRAVQGVLQGSRWCHHLRTTRHPAPGRTRRPRPSLKARCTAYTVGACLLPRRARIRRQPACRGGATAAPQPVPWRRRRRVAPPTRRLPLPPAGTVHTNGFGHLMRLNGREGGSKRASGRQLMQARLHAARCAALRAALLAAATAAAAQAHGAPCAVASCRRSLCRHQPPPAHPQLWDDLCEALRVREVSTEDVSNKVGAAALCCAVCCAVGRCAALCAALWGAASRACRWPSGPQAPSSPPRRAAQAGMELRVLHAAAHRMTWYGQWRYGFGRGGFNMRPQQVRARRRRACGEPRAAPAAACLPPWRRARCQPSLQPPLHLHRTTPCSGTPPLSTCMGQLWMMWWPTLMA